MPVFISESEVQAILPEEDCFLNSYIAYASKLGDSPLAYHLVNGFALLAALAPANLLVEDMNGGTHYANFWGMTVGRPGVDHKTSALKYATHLLAAAAPERIGSVVGSYEGIVKQLAPPFSTRLAPVTEMGHFLSATQGVGYQDKIKPFLTDIFDCQPYDRPLSGKRMNIPAPRLSIAAAVNHDLLQAHATPTDWGGGFMSRWFVLNAETERADPEYGPEKGEKERLVGWMRDLMRAKLESCEGLTPEARTFWRAWNLEWRDKMIESVSNNSQASIHGRVPMHAVKLALLMSFDFGAARSGAPWTIEEDILWRGTILADMHYRSIRDLAAAAQPTEYMRLRFQVISTIRNLTRHAPGAFASHAEILKQTTMGKRKLDEILESLVAEETTIQFRTDNGRFHYREFVETSEEELNVVDFMDRHTRKLMEGSTRAARAGTGGEELEDDDTGIPF